MIKSLTTFIIIIFSINFCHAQEYEHFTSWNRIAVQKKLTEHWELMADFHWRKQNDFTTHSFNPFTLNLMEGYRITTTYRIHSFAFSFAPFFVHSYPLYGKTNDFKNPIKFEIRPALYTEWTKPLSEKWTFRSRFGYEYRIFKRLDNSWGDEQSRVRLRLQLRYSVNKDNTVFVSEEPIYNTPPHLPANTFSQNQLYFAYNHTFTPHFSTEVGYIWNHRQRASLVEFDEENILQTHFVFKL
ncbi:MAG: DUF2490 domain-containing protein [Bacteroidota bacterium]